MEPAVLGQEHVFESQCLPVRLIVLGPERLHAAEGVSDEHAPLRVIAYRTVDNEPTQIAVQTVNVVLDLPEELVVPVDVLGKPVNSYDLVPKSTWKNWEGLASAYTCKAGDAFEYWLRILRWRCNRGWIGRPEIQGFESGWGTYLKDHSTGQDIWAWHAPGRMVLRDPVSLQEWNDVQEVLACREESPVYIDLMFDAVEQAQLGDLRRALTEAAVACEAYLRAVVIQSLPETVVDGIRKVIDEVNVAQLVNHAFPDLLTPNQVKEYKALRSDLLTLFKLRNTILHVGDAEGVTADRCEKLLWAVSSLLAIRGENAEITVWFPK